MGRREPCQAGNRAALSGAALCDAVSLSFVYQSIWVFLYKDGWGGDRVYRVLYRKWRPEGFSDVIGQPHVTETLKNEIKSGRISHAYLFTGSRGTGKTTCAKILSRAVNCLEPHDGEPCGKCSNCVGIMNGNIMDVVEMDAASNNSVNNIRDVLDEVMFTPGEAKYRVYIIDEVHMLSQGAFNALLKTLEEPPSHIVFILATTEVHKIPATILSRCQRFDFNRIAPEAIASRLEYIAEQEGVSLSHDGAMLIAAVADGAMRDALSILDRCIGLSDNIGSDIVREATGLAGRDYLFTLADAVRNEDIPQAINTINTLHRESKSISRLCEELTEHFRTLMLIKTMKKNAGELIIMSADEMERARTQAEKFSLSSIVRCIDVLQGSLERMFRGGSNKIEFETCMIKLCSPKLSDDLSSITARLEKLEIMVRQGTAVSQSNKNIDENDKKQEQPAQITQNENSNQEKPNVVTEPKKSSSDLITKLVAKAKPLDCWEEIMDEMKSRSTTLYHRMRGTCAYIADEYILIDAPDDSAFAFLRSDKTRNLLIRESIKKVTGHSYKIGPFRKPQEDAPVQKSKLDEFIEQISDSDIKVTVD